MLDLQTELIPFNLLNTINDDSFSSEELDSSKPSLIMFMCNHCPYVIHYHGELQRLAEDYQDDFNLVAISSNDIVNYPQDAPDKMNLLWKDLGLVSHISSTRVRDRKKIQSRMHSEFYLFDKEKIGISW